MSKLETSPRGPRSHVPVRTCLVCGQKRPRQSLMRLVLEPGKTGRVVRDPKQIMKGRGGYACPGCFPNLRLDKRVRKAFRGQVRELWVDRI